VLARKQNNEVILDIKYIIYILLNMQTCAQVVVHSVDQPTSIYIKLYIFFAVWLRFDCLCNILTSAHVFSDSTDKKILVPSPFKGQVLSCSILSTILSPEPVTLKQSSEKSLKIYDLIVISC
jgi:hypothetical protein